MTIPILITDKETMKIDRTVHHLRAHLSSRRRPASFRTLHNLIAERKRLRHRIGLLLAVCLPLGWLLLHFE